MILMKTIPDYLIISAILFSPVFFITGCTIDDLHEQMYYIGQTEACMQGNENHTYETSKNLACTIVSVDKTEPDYDEYKKLRKEISDESYDD